MAVELYDEHEQGERVRRWIKEYSSAIIIGLILAFAGIFGFRQWQDHQANQQSLAAEYYHAVNQRLSNEGSEAAAGEYQTMVDEVGQTAYTGLAGMQLAAAWVEDGRLTPAEQIYRDVLDNRRLRSLWPVASLRLARVLEAQGEYPDALSLLDGTAPAGYEAAWDETRGDVLFELSQFDQARSAWQAALERREADGINPRQLQIKIDAAVASGDAS